MALITVTVVQNNGLPSNFYNPQSAQIQDSSIKYVKQAGQYSLILYYDQQAAVLQELLVSETIYELFDMYAGFILITAQRIEGGNQISEPLLINANSVSYNVALSAKDPLSLSVIAYSNLAVGTFSTGDIITGDVSKATALVVTDDGVGLMVVHPIKGTITSADAISNQLDTPVTADVDSYTAANQKYIKYEPGRSTAVKTKDIVAMVNVPDSDRAITAVSIADKSFTIGGDHQADYTRDVPFMVDGSTGNDGAYSVVQSVLDGSDTVIYVAQTIFDSTADGDIKTA